MLIDSEGEAERLICSIVREAERRRRCLEAFAEAVREAHYHSEGLWAVTCSEDKVRLQVGPVIICNLGDKSARTERLWLALDRDSLARGGKEALLESFGEWKWSEKDKKYAAIPTRNGYYVPSERHEETWKEIKEHHFEAIRKAAGRGGLRSKTKEGHSPGVLEYIRNALGRNLPDPIYATWQGRGPFGSPPPPSLHAPPTMAIKSTSQEAESERVGTNSIPTNYPLPLAYSYRRADAEFETFRILKELYRNAEGLTIFLASLALTLAPTPTGKRKDSLLRAWRGKGATFGSWYGILDKTTPTIDEGKGQLYRSMKRLLGTPAHPSSFTESMAWLIDRRNDMHHRDLPVGTRADRLAEEARRRLEHCVYESAAIWQHPLRLVLDYDAVRNSNYVITTCLDFSVDHPVGRKVQERYQGIPKKHDLYILQDGKEWVSLHPFISVHYCSHCDARETYFVDAWQGTGEEASLRSFERAHEEVSQEIGQELTLRLG